MRQLEKEEVEEHSGEWNQALYQLQLMTGQAALRLINLYRYHPDNSPVLEYRSKVDALIEITDFKREYKERVISKTIPLEDVVFFCGHVNLQMQPTSKIFTFLICKMSLGRIGTYEDAKGEIDSIYVPPEKPEEPFHYSFQAKSHQQYQIRYEASFKIGDEWEVKNKDIICSICEKSKATLYCRQEKMHFCDDCGRNHHIEFNNPKSKFKHELERLNRINSLPLCENHSVKNEYFCLKCQKYVCNICIQKGTHNQNPEHIIKPIEFLYEEKAQNNNILPVKHQDKLTKILSNVSKRSKEIQQNYEDVKGKLMAEFEKALIKLQGVYREKLIRIRSDEIQLNMTCEKIEWAKAFVKHQQKNLKPVYYFKLQSRFEHELQNMKINNYQNAFTIEPDLAASANIIVGKKDDVQILTARTKSNANPLDKPHPESPGNINSSRINQAFKQPNQSNRKQQSLLTFDPKREPPRSGQLTLVLQNSNLHFFKVASANSKPNSRV